ncbi:hypothetical protein PHLCEN_2v7482 [Hermanssonia centrifuga]|uniref:Uncharacterized protein n=1 Tax=Hermanssonia centrifuga TaxID=98765 RepID=A0A2R6NWH8_9APHY|nr:hypothetical protein PHLCEN_2v7482 [Hermanssonia centrifuga]
MGRPLFSQSNSQPAVRVEPEQTHPAYPTWTYWNPFDPDSEDFFQDAEHEYPIYTTGLIVQGEQEDGRETPSVDGDNSSSEDTNSSYSNLPTVLSESAAPAQPVDDGSTYRATDRTAFSASPSMSSRRRSTPISTGHATSYIRTSYYVEEPPRSPSPPPQQRVQLRTTTDTVYVSPIDIPSRPSTPPNQSAYAYATPSPAPTVTPRLYAWGGYRGRAPPSTSPSAERDHHTSPTASVSHAWSYPVISSPTSPLPNYSARMSVAHIPSATIPMHRIVV